MLENFPIILLAALIGTAVNPSLTIVAQAVRTADHLLRHVFHGASRQSA